MILAIKNAIPDPQSDPEVDDQTATPAGVADRIVRRTLAKREGEYASEVRRLLDAALEVMRRCGTASRPRVADIVAAAGLSNDAFYRHFQSKDALVAAILEDGGERLRSYLAHQLAKEPTPEGQVRRWVNGVLSQADPDIAATTLAVLWNGSSVGGGMAAGRHFASAPLGSLLCEPFAALGSDAPELDAALAAHATLGMLSDCLWRQAQPTPAEVEHVTTFCLRAAARS
jgi:AcrR family transcriptional regulator